MIMSTTTLSTWGRIEPVAETHGWTASPHRLLNRTMILERGKQWVQVIFDKRGAITSARVGKLGGYNITGRTRPGQ